MSWVKPGARVTHNRYGAGTVIAIGKDIIKVRFGATERTLSYPSVFENGILSKSVAAPEPPKAKGPDWAVVGAAVSHRSFGDGIIETINGGHMTVRFGNTAKPFIYPDAFTAGHLTKGQVGAVQEQMDFIGNRRKEFVLYLKNQGYAETSSNAMASAVSRVGDFAVEKGYTRTPIFEIAEPSDLSRVWGLLEVNSDFIRLNNKQNRRFSMAMKHYINFISSASNAKSDAHTEPHTDKKNEPQKKTITLIEALRTGGFRCIDNRTTSSILWVLYEPAKKNEFDKIISGYNVQCKLEKRGALATNNAPAWRIMFN